MNTHNNDFVIDANEIFDIDTDEAAMLAICGTARNDIVVCAARALAESSHMTFRQFAVLAIISLAKSRDSLLDDLTNAVFRESEYYEL